MRVKFLMTAWMKIKAFILFGVTLLGTDSIFWNFVCRVVLSSRTWFCASFSNKVTSRLIIYKLVTCWRHLVHTLSNMFKIFWNYYVDYLEVEKHDHDISFGYWRHLHFLFIYKWYLIKGMGHLGNVISAMGHLGERIQEIFVIDGTIIYHSHTDDS